LGIATEPKTQSSLTPLPKPPVHLLLANKLTGVLRRNLGDLPTEQRAALRRDLRALYEQLRPIFASAEPK
jgi:hypothetical protein